MSGSQFRFVLLTPVALPLLLALLIFDREDTLRSARASWLRAYRSLA